MKLSARHPALAPFRLLLTEIETELCRQGLWETAPPAPAAFESGLPFCCDRMRFTQWIQWVFLPRTRALIEAGGPLPEVSGIRPMAEEERTGTRRASRSALPAPRHPFQSSVSS